MKMNPQIKLFGKKVKYLIWNPSILSRCWTLSLLDYSQYFIQTMINHHLKYLLKRVSWCGVSRDWFQLFSISIILRFEWDQNWASKRENFSFPIIPHFQLNVPHSQIIKSNFIFFCDRRQSFANFIALPFISLK